VFGSLAGFENGAHGDLLANGAIEARNAGFAAT